MSVCYTEKDEKLQVMGPLLILKSRLLCLLVSESGFFYALKEVRQSHSEKLGQKDLLEPLGWQNVAFLLHTSQSCTVFPKAATSYLDWVT